MAHSSEYVRQDDDEIDLIELATVLWQQKLVVIAITALVTALSIAYAYIVTPTYQTRALLKTVSEKELDEINRSELVAITPEQALFMVERKLDSYELWFDFFKQNPEL